VTIALSRRQFITVASAGIVAASLPATIWRRWRLSEAGADPRPRFFADPNDYATLADLVDRIIPPDLPPGTLPGAKAAGVADYIDFLLGAFLSATPFIFAGGPFSDRNPAGGQALTDDMAQPIPLTPLQSLAWRIRILGTKGAAAGRLRNLRSRLPLISSARCGWVQTNQRRLRMRVASFTASTICTLPTAACSRLRAE
jgi:hypothetical protein